MYVEFSPMLKAYHNALSNRKIRTLKKKLVYTGKVSLGEVSSGQNVAKQSVRDELSPDIMSWDEVSTHVRRHFSSYQIETTCNHFYNMRSSWK